MNNERVHFQCPVNGFPLFVKKNGLVHPVVCLGGDDDTDAEYGELGVDTAACWVDCANDNIRAAVATTLEGAVRVLRGMGADV